MDITALLAQDNREKRQAKGGQAVGKKRPRALVMPSTLTGGRPYSGLSAPPIVKVCIVTGRILIWRWPWPDNGENENMEGGARSDDIQSARGAIMVAAGGKSGVAADVPHTSGVLPHPGQDYPYNVLYDSESHCRGAAGPGKNCFPAGAPGIAANFKR